MDKRLKDDKKSLEKQVKKDLQNADQYTEKMVVKKHQEKVQTMSMGQPGQQKWKYIETKVYKNGVSKRRIVGMEKLNDMGQLRTIFDSGIDKKKFDVAPRVKRKRG